MRVFTLGFEQFADYPKGGKELRVFGVLRGGKSAPLVGYPLFATGCFTL